MGGTWDLFRFPGIRSDSDMFTLGYSFRPWDRREAIADGASILRYIEDTAAETYEPPALRELGSIEEWTLGGGGTIIGISIVLP